MLRNDIVNHPTHGQVELLKQKKTRNAVEAVISSNQVALERDPYEAFTEEEMAEAKKTLAKEMDYVKQRIGHGDLPIESYSKVWDECYAQVRKLRYFYGSDFRVDIVQIFSKIIFDFFLCINDYGTFILQCTLRDRCFLIYVK